MLRIGIGVLLGFLCSAGIADIAEADSKKPVLPDRAVATALSGKAFEHGRRSLQTLVAENRTDALVDALTALNADTGMAPAARAALTWESLVALRDMPATGRAGEFLQRISESEPTTWRWLEDGGHRVAVPLYSEPAAARDTLRAWRIRDLAGRVADSLREGYPADELLPRGEPDITAKALHDAVRMLPGAQLAAAQSALVEAMQAGFPAERALAAIHERRPQAVLAERLVARGDAAFVVHHLESLVATLPWSEARSILASAMDRPEIGSVAVSVLAGRAGDRPDVVDELIARFDHPELGGSAAAGLATLHDPAVIQAVGDRLAESRDELVIKRAILMLRLEGSPLAREQLQRLLARDDVPVHLKREARR